MSRLQAGDRISNYILTSPIGSGSFGEVWKAQHHVFAETVAIKVPTDPQYVRNLQREGVTVHGLRHPNIVRVIDLDPYADPPYLVMEYVDGVSLRQIIERHPSGLPVDAVLPILEGILRALKRAHEADVIHRDIKPENVLVAGGQDLKGMNPERVKVTDFGLGRVGRDTCVSMMQSGSMVTDEGRSISGTIAYMAPEQRDGRDVDARCDLYACGVVLFEMLTGERPQGTDLPGDLRAGIPPAVDEIFRQCYTRLDRRYGSAEEVLRALEKARSEPAGPIAPPPPPPRTPPQAASGRECPMCRTRGEPGDYFCIACGHQLVTSVPRCPSCHAFVQRSDNFCIFCGTKLHSTTMTGG